MNVKKAIFTRLVDKVGCPFYRVSIYYFNDNYVDSAYFESEPLALEYLHDLQNKYKLATVNFTNIKWVDKKYGREITEYKNIVVAKLKEDTYNRLFRGN